MTKQIQDNKRIAKNTVFLYLRMFIVMGATLYASRVVLDKLGVVDYGLYNVVAGVVTFLTFLNTCLGTGTSRFIMFAMGQDNKDKLQKTFNTAFFSHLFMAVILIIIMETAGLWFVYHKLVISPERFSAAVITYHISVFTLFVTLLQGPYTATIMSHEKMNVYAYISLYEAFAKLSVVYLLSVCDFDKLVFYAALTAIVNISITLFYMFFCRVKYKETTLKKYFDKSIFKAILSFSAWNLIAQMSESLKGQGILILLNLFLSPVVVAAQSIANQVGSALSHFLYNFRSAINPQVVKLYASGEKEQSKKLTLRTMPYVFDLSLLICLPLVLVMKQVLQLWLVEIPDYTIIFCQYVTIQRIIDNLNGHLHTQLTASGKVRQNSIAALFLCFGQFVLLYFILKLGGSAMWVQYCALFVTSAFAFGVKPFILVKYESFTIKDIYRVYLRCFITLILSIIIPLCLLYNMGCQTIADAVIVVFVTLLSVSFFSFVTMEKNDRNVIFQYVKYRL